MRKDEDKHCTYALTLITARRSEISSKGVPTHVISATPVELLPVQKGARGGGECKNSHSGEAFDLRGTRVYTCVA